MPAGASAAFALEGEKAPDVAIRRRADRDAEQHRERGATRSRDARDDRPAGRSYWARRPATREIFGVGREERAGIRDDALLLVRPSRCCVRRLLPFGFYATVRDRERIIFRYG